MQRANWLPPNDTLALGPHQVDVWCARLDLPADVLERLEAALSADEVQRAACFHFPTDRDRFIAAHGCLRDVLARYLPCEPRDLVFFRNYYGKPALHQHPLEFNLSHSGDLAVIAVALERTLGVDVERVRQGLSSQGIARQYFSKAELADLETLPPEQREMAFFACWTRKEAYIKAQGLGLSLPLESFDVSLTPDEPALLRATRPNPSEAARWTLFSLEVDPCYAAAVAVDGQNLEFTLRDWNINK